MFWCVVDVVVVVGGDVVVGDAVVDGVGELVLFFAMWLVMLLVMLWCCWW